ncbi:Putative flippase GtrA (transmembrane translocase of bactoprenol-linked glucose) [Novosphingobium sp. CF614]|nr:Putative flippase GtrA (transmembrane translocase of bactoprenol-linked glucose) [Novosphingobium sp. CF614]
MNRESGRDFKVSQAVGGTPRQGLAARLLSVRVGAMLMRNTVVSCFVFVIGLVTLWMLVSLAGVDEVIAAGIGFVIANTLHYALGRSWIFRGSERGLRTGYVLFLINAGVGLFVTMGLYALMLRFTAMNYLVARIVVSVFAGLVVFVLNAVLNFRQV